MPAAPGMSDQRSGHQSFTFASVAVQLRGTEDRQLPFSTGFGTMYFPGMKAFIQGAIPMLDSEVPAADSC